MRKRLAAGVWIALAVSCAAPPSPTPAKSGEASTPAHVSEKGTEVTSRIWYMAPVPCGGGRGTLEKPWCIADALSSGRVRPGDTIYARLGARYTLPKSLGVVESITSTLKGTADRRITVQPYPEDQTTPTTLIQIACDQGEERKQPLPCFDIRSNYVDYYEFEVAYFGDPRRTAVHNQWDLPGFGGGVRMTADPERTYGQGNRLINFVVHDTNDNVYKTDAANGTEFYGMINYNYGFYYDVVGPPKIHRTGGHGFYLRSGLLADGSRKGCTKGPDNSNPERSALVDSIVGPGLIVSGQPTGSLAFQDYGTCGGCAMHRNWLFDGNFFLGRTLSGGCAATDDFTLGTRNQTLSNNWLSDYTAGYSAAGCDAVTIDHNILFRSMYSMIDSAYAKRTPMYLYQQFRKHRNPCRRGVTFTNNTYWGHASAADAGTDDDDTNGFKASWYPGGGNVYLDNDSTPDRNFTVVRPNAFRPGSCNVYVANFLNLPAVPVDLSGCGLADGARFEVRSIYNYLGKPVGSGTYSVASPEVAFPMTVAANPVADSVGHLTDGTPNSYPDMAHSLTGPGGNIYRNAFVVLTVPTGVAPATPPESYGP